MLYNFVNFPAALTTNKHGRLNDEQVASLQKMLKMRQLTAWIMILSWGFLGLISAPFVFSAAEGEDGLQLIMGILAAVSILDTMWGIYILVTCKRAFKTLTQLEVKKETGTPTVYQYSTPARIPNGAGMTTHFVLVRAGWLSLNDFAYGILPGHLFDTIERNREADFYYISMPVSGFKKRIVVNYETV